MDRGAHPSALRRFSCLLPRSSGLPVTPRLPEPVKSLDRALPDLYLSASDQGRSFILLGYVRSFAGQDHMKGSWNPNDSLASEIRVLQRALAEAEEREQVLKCLWHIARFAQSQDVSFKQILEQLVHFLRTAGQAPVTVYARILMNGEEYTSQDFRGVTFTQSKNVPIQGKPGGTLEVYYDSDQVEEIISRSFRDEVSLIEAVAEIIGLLAERKRAQGHLCESERNLRALFQDSRDLMFFKDTQGKYTDVNPAVEKLLGIPASEIIGATSQDIFGKEVGDRIDQTDRRLMAGESIEHLQVRTIRGEDLTFHDKRAPLRDELGRIVGTFCASRNVTDLTSRMPPDPPLVDPGLYRSGAMRECLERAHIAAATNSIILLLGESGCGKDHLARWVHEHSKRAPGPFFALNCAALPHELAESELFGHEAGAFTGARARKKGLLELAEGGTLLLNEIGELPLSLQSRLLTFLDTRSFLRVGGEQSIRVNARILAATYRDLTREIAEGRFLEPLFYRLNVFPIRVPALRERPEDIPVLAAAIAKKLAAEMQIDEVPQFDSMTLSSLAQYDWPGNVRELRNVLERSLMISSHGKVNLVPLFPEEGKRIQDWCLTSFFPASGNLRKVRNEFMKAICDEAARRSDGNRTAAAKLLGISRNALYRYLSLHSKSDSESPHI